VNGDTYMVNINIEIPDDIHKMAKIKAAEDELTLGELVRDAVHSYCGGK
jgi:hypothetical protein